MPVLPALTVPVNTLNQGLVSKLLPTALADSQQQPQTVRLSKYGEQVTIGSYLPGMYGPADEGTMLVCTSPTAGTGLTGVTAQTTINLTGPACYIYNPEAAGGKSLYMGWLKMIATAAATSASAQFYACVLDTTARAVTTNNFVTLTPNSPNGNTSAVIQPSVLFQNNATVSVIAAAGTAARVVARGCLGGLNIVGDEMIIAFGQDNISPHPGLTAAQVAGISKRVSNAPPVVIGPGQSLAIHLWGSGQAAAYSPEVELVMWAR